MISSKNIGATEYDAPAHESGEAMRLLVVDDNEMVRASLQDFFEAEGYEVTVAEDGVEGLQSMQQVPTFDVVLLDVGLPKKNGFDVLRESQEMGLLPPVLMLTGRGEQENILKGFGLGAADYVVKPFNPDDLSARVRGIIGRGQAAAKELLDAYQFDHIQIDFRKEQVLREGKVVEVPELEFDVLRYLVQHRGQVVTVKRLLREALTIDPDMVAFSVDHDTMMRTIEQHVASLRDKIELNPSKPKYIETVYGLGYRFNG